MRGSGFTKAAFVAALTGALLAAFAPTYSSCTAATPGTLRCGSATGFAVNGWWILFVSSVPVAISLVAVLRPTRRVTIVTAVALWACCLIGSLSIGLFFIPAAVLMTVAAARRDRAAAPAS